MIVLNAILFFFLPNLSSILYRFLGNIVLFWKIYYGTTLHDPSNSGFSTSTNNVSPVNTDTYYCGQYVIFTRSVVIKLICLCHNTCDKCSVCCVISVELMLFSLFVDVFMSVIEKTRSRA